MASLVETENRDASGGIERPVSGDARLFPGPFQEWVSETGLDGCGDWFDVAATAKAKRIGSSGDRAGSTFQRTCAGNVSPEGFLFEG